MNKDIIKGIAAFLGCIGLAFAFAASGYEFHALTQPKATDSHPTRSIDTPTVEPSPEAKPDVKYGQTFRFAGNPGLTAKVLSPKRVTVKDTIGQDYKYFYEFTIVITNISYRTWNIEVSPIDFDVVGGAFYSGDYPESIAVGKTVTLKHIFGVTTLKNPVFSIEMDMGYGPHITWG